MQEKDGKILLMRLSKHSPKNAIFLFSSSGEVTLRKRNPSLIQQNISSSKHLTPLPSLRIVGSSAVAILAKQMLSSESME
jgi:hypothetical protein